MHWLKLSHLFPTLLLIILTFVLVFSSGSTLEGQQSKRIIFMHHSTGQGLVTVGKLRERLTALGYEFWSHGYNAGGLTDGSGTPLGLNWNVPDDNTDPDGWAAIFQQPITSPAENTFSHMLEFDVIMFKSCFPVSNIQSDAQLDDYRAFYLIIRDIADRHPDKLFIPLTQPPLIPGATTPEAAARARRWATYMTSNEYLLSHPNIVVFDLFSHLADENGFLRAAYRIDEQDSHPNALANRVVGADLAEFIDQSIRGFTPSLAQELTPPALVPVTQMSSEAG